MPQRILTVILVGLLIGLIGVPPSYAQAPVAGEGPPPVRLSEKQLEDLVSRIALYPDDLLAIVLPASTFPVDVVQADRFLQKLKKEPKLEPDPRWDQSIRSLLNYPEVVSMMSRDLDWTQDLGEAVVSQQADVMKAIQIFRARVSNAGNLKTDDKQIIIKEKETIKIVPANPEVIYVPQYQPSTVVVYSSAPGLCLLSDTIPRVLLSVCPRGRFCHGRLFRGGHRLGLQLEPRSCRLQRKRQPDRQPQRQPKQSPVPAAGGSGPPASPATDGSGPAAGSATGGPSPPAGPAAGGRPGRGLPVAITKAAGRSERGAHNTPDGRVAAGLR